MSLFGLHGSGAKPRAVLIKQHQDKRVRKCEKIILLRKKRSHGQSGAVRGTEDQTGDLQSPAGAEPNNDASRSKVTNRRSYSRLEGVVQHGQRGGMLGCLTS